VDSPEYMLRERAGRILADLLDGMERRPMPGSAEWAQVVREADKQAREQR
jgi:hypothetical protein